MGADFLDELYGEGGECGHVWVAGRTLGWTVVEFNSRGG